MEEVKEVMGRLAGRKNGALAKRAVREALDRIARSLTRHPELSPFGATPLSDGTRGTGEAAAEKVQGESRPVGGGERTPQERKPKKEARKAAVEQLTPNAVIQRLKMGGAQVSCCLDSFGPDGPEVFTEGSIIYVNRDHPLYQRESRKKDTHVLNLARLITQEIAMMKDGRNAREAYDHQSILLKDAFLD